MSYRVNTVIPPTQPDGLIFNYRKKNYAYFHRKLEKILKEYWNIGDFRIYYKTVCLKKYKQRWRNYVRVKKHLIYCK